MKRSLRVMDDPRLDSIFTDVYLRTMEAVERREGEKRRRDHIDAYAELFEEDLRRRDLTEGERREFAMAFREYVMKTIDRRKRAEQVRRRAFLLGGSGILVVGLSVFLLYAAIARPFMPVAKVETELQYYIEKVESGYGNYTRRFYRLLRRQDRKLGPDRVAYYDELMYSELDEHFQDLIAKLEQGEVVYYDDARRWAGHFPEAEERKERKQQAGNAMAQGVGRTVGDTVKSVGEAVKDLLNKASDLIQKNTEEQ